MYWSFTRGGLASVAGLAANAPTITFSPAGVSRRMITAIGLKSEDIIRRVNVGKLRFYTVKHDWLDYFQQTLAIPKVLGCGSLCLTANPNRYWIDCGHQKE